MRVNHKSSRSLIERAELEELVVERAVEMTRYGDSLGEHRHADLFWRLARRCRINALMLRTQSNVASHTNAKGIKN